MDETHPRYHLLQPMTILILAVTHGYFEDYRDHGLTRAYTACHHATRKAHRRHNALTGGASAQCTDTIKDN